MRHSCYISTLGFVLLIACRPPAPPRTSRTRQITVSTQPVSAPSPLESNDSPSLLLRGALAPPQARQAYRIEFHLSAELQNDSSTARSENVLFEVSGSLTPTSPTTAREVSLTMSIDSLHAKVESGQTSQILRTFEFDSNNRGETNALNRLLDPLSGARLRLWVTPAGELRQLRGLTQLTNDRRLTAPSDLASILGLLNDTAFEYMVARCLFPKLPSSPLDLSHRWQVTEDSFPLDPCLLTATLTGGIVSREKDPQGLPVIGLEASGPIQASTADCPIHLIDGRHHLWRHDSWTNRSLFQQIDRVMEFGPRTLRDEKKPNSTPRYLRKETWISTRAGAATQTRPE